MHQHGYGLPLVCPKCPPKNYLGILKVPGSKAVPCPNCGSILAPKSNMAAGRDSIIGLVKENRR